MSTGQLEQQQKPARTRVQVFSRLADDTKRRLVEGDHLLSDNVKRIKQQIKDSIAHEKQSRRQKHKRLLERYKEKDRQREILEMKKSGSQLLFDESQSFQPRNKSTLQTQLIIQAPIKSNVIELPLKLHKNQLYHTRSDEVLMKMQDITISEQKELVDQLESSFLIVQGSNKASAAVLPETVKDKHRPQKSVHLTSPQSFPQTRQIKTIGLAQIASKKKDIDETEPHVRGKRWPNLPSNVQNSLENLSLLSINLKPQLNRYDNKAHTSSQHISSQQLLKQTIAYKNVARKFHKNSSKKQLHSKSSYTQLMDQSLSAWQDDSEKSTNSDQVRYFYTNFDSQNSGKKKKESMPRLQQFQPSQLDYDSEVFENAIKRARGEKPRPKFFPQDPDKDASHVTPSSIYSNNFVNKLVSVESEKQKPGVQRSYQPEVTQQISSSTSLKSHQPHTTSQYKDLKLPHHRDGNIKTLLSTKAQARLAKSRATSMDLIHLERRPQAEDQQNHYYDQRVLYTSIDERKRIIEGDPVLGTGSDLMRLGGLDSTSDGMSLSKPNMFKRQRKLRSDLKTLLRM